MLTRVGFVERVRLGVHALYAHSGTGFVVRVQLGVHALYTHSGWFCRESEVVGTRSALYSHSGWFCRSYWFAFVSDIPYQFIIRRLHIRYDGFDSQQEPLAFDIYTELLLTQRAQAHFAVSINLLNFLFNML